MSGRGRRGKKPLTFGGLCLALLALFAAYMWEQYLAPSAQMPPQDGEMSLIVLDVGQGDSLLLHSDGQWALVDAGTPDSADAILQAMDDYPL